MIQIGGTSVWFREGEIRCESYTGDAHGNSVIKQRLISASEVSADKFALETNKGNGYIQFNESGNGHYTVELVLPKFFGSHRMYGSSSSAQVNLVVEQLKALSPISPD